MHLVTHQKKDKQVHWPCQDHRHLQQLKQPGAVIPPDRIKVGGYYIYKENHGMVCIVKILESTSQEEWIGYRLMVKRVVYSYWSVPKNYVFETGYHLAQGHPIAWHLEPAMVLLDNHAAS